MNPKPIPYPDLTARYITLTKMNSAARLDEAERLSAPELAKEFNEAAREFDSFESQQPFFPLTAGRDEDKNPKSDTRTFGWAMKIRALQEVSVAGDPSLNFRYVEREVIPTRTKPALPFVSPDGAHIRIDLILANASSKRLIVGELKVGNDKDPFSGLVQALAGTAQLVSPGQRKRLREHLPEGDHLAPLSAEPLVDIYVLLAEFPTVGRHRFEQLQAAVEIAGQLESESLCDGLGRVRILALHGSEDAISATTELPIAEA